MNEPQIPQRDPRIIAAAKVKAAENIARTILNSMKDRGGNHADVADLLARVNALVVGTLTDGVPEARAKAEGMIALIAENTIKVTAGIRAREMIRSTIPTKGLRP